MTTKMRLAGSEEVFAAPAYMDESAAVRWLARLYHPTADRVITPIGDRRYRCTNNRRGVAERSAVITVVRD